LNIHLVVRSFTTFAALGAASTLFACSAAPGDDATSKSDDAITRTAPVQSCALQTKATVCDSGEKQNGNGTICDVVCEQATGPACPATQRACGATLAVPDVLRGCTAGMTMSGYSDAFANVWVCPDTIVVPTSLGIPTSLGGSRPQQSIIESIRVYRPSDGDLSCNSCVGVPLPGKILVVQWLVNADVNPGACGVMCHL
jgi:hypothetical protein